MKAFPVVHIGSVNTAVEQSMVAIESGADGVYLIDHNEAKPDRVFESFAILRERTDAYAGVNLLGLTAMDAMLEVRAAINKGVVPAAPSGLWVDDIRRSGSTSGLFGDNEPSIYKFGQDGMRQMRLLGGVCFKYTPTFSEQPGFVEEEVRALRGAVDVIVTSGSATGSPPSVAKMQAIRRAADEAPVAVASGISVDNIHQYVGLVDEILAASSIETTKGSGIFDKAKLKEFIDKAHSIG